MIKVTSKGDYSKATKYLAGLKKPISMDKMHKYAQEGLVALSSVTPVDSGLTRDSWYYTITETDGHASIEFHNDNINDYVNIAIILQYGHATRNGGWVQGRDYINPAIQPIFDKITNKAWEEVISR